MDSSSGWNLINLLSSTIWVDLYEKYYGRLRGYRVAVDNAPLTADIVNIRNINIKSSRSCHDKKKVITFCGRPMETVDIHLVFPQCVNAPSMSAHFGNKLNKDRLTFCIKWYSCVLEMSQDPFRIEKREEFIGNGCCAFFVLKSGPLFFEWHTTKWPLHRVTTRRRENDVCALPYECVL